MIVCLDCHCPAAIETGWENWTCPNCGCGFVKLATTTAALEDR